MKTAWGYWAMTPELTFGGGYAGSLGNIGYGYDGACTCYYTDNADKLIKNYTRLSNAARQSEITQQISEIVGGADALVTTDKDA